MERQNVLSSVGALVECLINVYILFVKLQKLMMTNNSYGDRIIYYLICNILSLFQKLMLFHLQSQENDKPLRDLPWKVIVAQLFKIQRKISPSSCDYDKESDYRNYCIPSKSLSPILLFKKMTHIQILTQKIYQLAGLLGFRRNLKLWWKCPPPHSFSFKPQDNSDLIYFV